MSRARRRPSLTGLQLRLAWQTASLLLGYPDEDLLRRVDLMRQATGHLPPPVAEPLGAFLTHLESTPLAETAEAFVAAFDHQRRCCPYLTYCMYGDTRNRGVALLRFKTAYRAAGLELTDGELPDHLAVVLEFGATADPLPAWELLIDHRAGVELLRLALAELVSPWAHVAEGVCATLPPLPGDGRQAVMRLAAQGPPDEEVGLAPFASAAYAPAHRGPLLLPLPTSAPFPTAAPS